MFAAGSRQNVYRCSSDFCTLRELLARRSVRPCQTQMASCPALSPLLFAPILLRFALDRPEPTFSPNERLWNVSGRLNLLRLDARELDHLGPLLGFGCYICTELRGGEDHRDRAEVGEPRPYGWVC